MIQAIDHHTVYCNSAPGLHSRHGYFPGLIELHSGDLLALFILAKAMESTDATMAANLKFGQP